MTGESNRNSVAWDGRRRHGRMRGKWEEIMSGDHWKAIGPIGGTLIKDEFKLVCKAQ
jgi:hypothetical protein